MTHRAPPETDELPRTARTGVALPSIGWREWVRLPQLGGVSIKAKVDTGARTSSLHAFDIRHINKAGSIWVAFNVHPRQRLAKPVVECEAPLIEERYVTDSGGRRTLRPVVATTINLAGQEIEVELTLIARDEMGFRMLIGRQAVRGRFLVDAGRSFLGGKRKKKKKKKVAKAKAATKRTPAKTDS